MWRCAPAGTCLMSPFPLDGRSPWMMLLINDCSGVYTPDPTSLYAFRTQNISDNRSVAIGIRPPLPDVQTSTHPLAINVDGATIVNKHCDRSYTSSTSPKRSRPSPWGLRNRPNNKQQKLSPLEREPPRQQTRRAEYQALGRLLYSSGRETCIWARVFLVPWYGPRSAWTERCGASGS